MLVFAVVLWAGTSLAADKDNNPPGAKGGPGTNWENPPGSKGGPGASPDVTVSKPPKKEFCEDNPAHPACTGAKPYHKSKFCRKHPEHKKCAVNPPGPAGGPGAGTVPPPPPGKKHDIDNNPPGAKGGAGTNWENPPGPKGGPGASPDRKKPKAR
ncbi:MAG: hypothetical protein WC551_13150 [Patescibacteria group bacterium]